MLKAPPISRDLIEYLEKVYAPAHLMVATSVHPHEIAAEVHRENGVQKVINHLRSVYEDQQNEDPTNVSQDT